MSHKLEMQRCHHCGHEWEPRVKNPKKCPQCQNPLWKSSKPKRKAAPTSIALSEEAAPTPPTTATNMQEVPSAASGAGEENQWDRLQREVEERLRRLANAPVD